MLDRDSFEQNAPSVKHNQKAKDTLKATATKSHFVANSDLNNSSSTLLKSVVFCPFVQNMLCSWLNLWGVNFPSQTSEMSVSA